MGQYNDLVSHSRSIKSKIHGGNLERIFTQCLLYVDVESRKNLKDKKHKCLKVLLKVIYINNNYDKSVCMNKENI